MVNEGNKIRVAQVDEGYDFRKLDHNNWEIKTDWKEVGFMIIMFLVPGLAINLGYFFFNDMLMAHLVYQIALVFLTFIYPFITLKPLNIDILYIKPLRHFSTQIKLAICNGIFVGALVIFIPITLKMIDIGFINDTMSKFKLLIPSGLIEDSAVQDVSHIIYFFIMFFEYVLILPVVESRYYLIIIHSRLNEKFYASVIIFFIFVSNHIYILYFYIKIDLVLGFFILGLILMHSFVLIWSKIEFGIMYVFIYQMAINLGIVIFLIICNYSTLIFSKKGSLEIYTKSNSFDFMLDLFVDEVNLDVE